jgi:ADP-heptose:LPS heptosyltransferase
VNEGDNDIEDTNEGENELDDFSDTAALISCLDLIISVDTSTAHLAAAMGKPVWILNRHDNCWRWLEDGDHSLWYPTAKLYRQKISGEWDTVLEDVKMDLITFFN